MNIRLNQHSLRPLTVLLWIGIICLIGHFFSPLQLYAEDEYEIVASGERYHNWPELDSIGTPMTHGNKRLVDLVIKWKHNTDGEITAWKNDYYKQNLLDMYNNNQILLAIRNHNQFNNVDDERQTIGNYSFTITLSAWGEEAFRGRNQNGQALYNLGVKHDDDDILTMTSQTTETTLAQSMIDNSIELIPNDDFSSRFSVYTLSGTHSTPFIAAPRPDINLYYPYLSQEQYSYFYIRVKSVVMTYLGENETSDDDDIKIYNKIFLSEDIQLNVTNQPPLLLFNEETFRDFYTDSPTPPLFQLSGNTPNSDKQLHEYAQGGSIGSLSRIGGARLGGGVFTPETIVVSIAFPLCLEANLREAWGIELGAFSCPEEVNTYFVRRKRTLAQGEQLQLVFKNRSARSQQRFLFLFSFPKNSDNQDLNTIRDQMFSNSPAAEDLTSPAWDYAYFIQYKLWNETDYYSDISSIESGIPFELPFRFFFSTIRWGNPLSTDPPTLYYNIDGSLNSNGDLP